MNNLILRDARPNDATAIHDVTLAAYQQYAPTMGPLWNMYRDDIEKTIANPSPAAQIVAAQDGKIVGTVLLFPSGTEFDVPDGTKFKLSFPEIRLLAVLPAARGHGIGAALTRECMERAKKAGDSAIALHTTELMQTAKQMYEKMGFVRTPETDFEPAPNVLIMGYRYDLNNK